MIRKCKILDNHIIQWENFKSNCSNAIVTGTRNHMFFFLMEMVECLILEGLWNLFWTTNLVIGCELEVLKTSLFLFGIKLLRTSNYIQ